MAKLVIRSEGLPAEVIELKNGTHRFGRSSENDFQIEHSTVSRFHCEIQVQDTGMSVRDLDSSNGTFINDQPVARESFLEKGHTLRIGDVKMEVKEVPKANGANGTNGAHAAEANTLACANHPTQPASMKCTKCQKVFCGSCIHLMKRLNGQYLRLCPVCSGHCEALEAPKQQAPKKILGGLFDKLLAKKTTTRPFDDGRAR